MENNTLPENWKLNIDFKIPKFESTNFTIELLNIDHLVKDYKAFMSSIEIINRTRNSQWPFEGFTIEENEEDLQWHNKENEARRSMAFVVRALNGEYAGCFYLYPIGVINKDIITPMGADVDVSWWVTQKAFDSGKYELLYSDIKTYLKSWPSNKPWYSNTIIPSN